MTSSVSKFHIMSNVVMIKQLLNLLSCVLWLIQQSIRKRGQNYTVQYCDCVVSGNDYDHELVQSIKAIYNFVLTPSSQGYMHLSGSAFCKSMI